MSKKILNVKKIKTMKKLVFLLLATFSLSMVAQDNLTEGIIISSQKMSSNNEEMNAQLQMVGDTSTTVYFKGDKSRSETSSAMTGDVTIIMDNAKKEMMMLMSNPMYGKKYSIQSTEVKPEDLEGIVVEKGDATKTVLGYKCQQYIIKMSQQGQDIQMEMFTTTKIEAPTQTTASMGTKVEGFPLFFAIKMNQMGSDIEVTNEVTEIKKETVADDKFDMTPPEGYEKMDGM